MIKTVKYIHIKIPKNTWMVIVFQSFNTWMSWSSSFCVFRFLGLRTVQTVATFKTLLETHFYSLAFISGWALMIILSLCIILSCAFTLCSVVHLFWSAGYLYWLPCDSFFCKSYLSSGFTKCKDTKSIMHIIVCFNFISLPVVTASSLVHVWPLKPYRLFGSSSPNTFNSG